ncbi:MAG: hypothetical protein Q8O67_16240 [Deltaproteobacteria bacterium]|nr:hypothetical protein [Deltaproteobacteria bacterium]
MLRALLLLPVIALLGCDDGVTPALSGFRFDGPAEDSPLVLLLSVDFHDGDGDLSEGLMETFIDDRPTSAGPLSLTTLFLESGVALGATDGTLRFVLELAFGVDAPESGASFGLGVRATDPLLHTSSTQELTLKISE